MKIVDEYLTKLGYTSSAEIFPGKYRYLPIRELAKKGHVNIIYLHKNVKGLEQIVAYCPRNLCDIVFSKDRPKFVPNNCYLGKLRDPDDNGDLYITTVHIGALQVGIEFYLETLKLRTET